MAIFNRISVQIQLLFIWRSLANGNMRAIQEDRQEDEEFIVSTPGILTRGPNGPSRESAPLWR